MAPKHSKTLASRPIPVNLDFSNPNNKFLFRTSEKHAKFHNVMKGKSFCECYHALRPERHPEVYDSVRPYADFWSFTFLLTITNPAFELLVQLFYANAEFNDNACEVVSWLFGKLVQINPERLCQWFKFQVTPNHRDFYLSRSEEWLDRDGGSFEHYQSYLIGKKPLDKVTDYLPIQRIIFYFANNILAPVAKLKSNLERRNAYLLRNLWYKTLKINIPFLMYHHMKAQSRTGSLPYGHILTWICEKHGIVIPAQILDSRQIPNKDLLSVSKYKQYGYYKYHMETGGFQYLPDSDKRFHVFPPLDDAGNPVWPADTTAAPDAGTSTPPVREPPEPRHDFDDEAVDFDYTTGTDAQAARAFYRRTNRNFETLFDNQFIMQQQIADLHAYITRQTFPGSSSADPPPFDPPSET